MFFLAVKKATSAVWPVCFHIGMHQNIITSAALRVLKLKKYLTDKRSVLNAFSNKLGYGLVANVNAR